MSWLSKLIGRPGPQKEPRRPTHRRPHPPQPANSTMPQTDSCSQGHGQLGGFLGNVLQTNGKRPTRRPPSGDKSGSEGQRIVSGGSGATQIKLPGGKTGTSGGTTGPKGGGITSQGSGASQIGFDPGSCAPSFMPVPYIVPRRAEPESILT